MINWDLPNVHELTVTVPAEAIDVMGHVNNTEYLRFMEQIAWHHTTELGLGWDLYQKLNRGMVARHTEVDYLAPAFEGENLKIGTWIVHNDERILSLIHISEPTRRTPISYAVFCLKKKKKK